MESGIWARVKTVIATFFAGTTHPSSEEHGRTRSNSPSPGNFDTLYKSVNLLPSLWFDYRGKRNCAHVFKDGGEMKIIIFSIKFAKFTGFFDKFLKIILPVNNCNSKTYLINMSVSH
ncbi:MAG: hypothetical protein OXG62_12730 [Nitrospinae bacterium]|nr:hypothetical protein [Nitrospinota bacterium]